MTEIKLNTDREGFISQECPACGHRFKVKLGDGSPRPVTYCPYCRHKNREGWWTRLQAGYIEAAAGVGDHQLDRMLLDVLKGSKEVNLKKLPGAGAEAPAEPQEAWPVVEFPSREVVRHDGTALKLFCPLTGEELVLRS
jgi:hypothetical protein